MPFLEVITRCYKRPRAVLINIESLMRQTDGDWLQLFLVDSVGRGVGWANAQMQRIVPFGDYVWVLDDDDVCASPTLVADLKAIVKLHTPDCILIKMDHGPLGILPDPVQWGDRNVVEAHIGVSAYVVSRETWTRHCHAWSDRYAGDFDFIKAVLDDPTVTVYWYDCVASAVQRISHGEPEHATA